MLFFLRHDRERQRDTQKSEEREGERERERQRDHQREMCVHSNFSANRLGVPLPAPGGPMSRNYKFLRDFLIFFSVSEREGERESERERERENALDVVVISNIRPLQNKSCSSFQVVAIV